MRGSGNDLATVQFLAFCYVLLSNNSTAKVAKIFVWAKTLATFISFFDNNILLVLAIGFIRNGHL